GEFAVGDLLTDEPCRGIHERHDEQSADHRRDSEAADRAPAIFGEEDAADDRRQPDQERGGGDLADGAFGIPQTEVVDLAGDVTETVVQALRALLVPAPASPTGCLEAARDQGE